MDCNLIRDLLPLYADGVASTASTEAIEKHIETCPECAKLLERMRAPIEPEPVDEATSYMTALHAQERRRKRRTILAIVLTALVCVIGWWIYMETHFYGEQIVTVSTDEAEILSQMPDLALTDAEKELALTILDHELFSKDLCYDAVEVTEYPLEDAIGIISPVLPEGANVTAVVVIGPSVQINYRVGDMRTILEYTDGDGTGHVDAIRKYMSDSPYEYAGGVEFVGDVEEVFMVTYAVGTGITQYAKTEAQHIWFSFMNMP